MERRKYVNGGLEWLYLCPIVIWSKQPIQEPEKVFPFDILRTNILFDVRHLVSWRVECVHEHGW